MCDLVKGFEAYQKRVKAACGKAEKVAAALIRGLEEYVAGHDDELARVYREQIRDNLAGAAFNEISSKLGPDDFWIIGVRDMDRICDAAADSFAYRSWYVREEIEKICSDFYAAMKGYELDIPMKPFTEVYRINESDYVDYGVWERYWEDKPEIERDIWIVADNGQYSTEDLVGMPPEKISAIVESDDFEPENTYCTMTDDEGYC